MTLRRIASLAALIAFAAIPALARANTCAPAASGGTAPSDFRTYCWIDFSGYNDTQAQTGGQPFTFTLPDGSTLSMTVTTTVLKGNAYNTGATAINPSPVPSWSGAAFGNSAFLGIPGLPVLYEAQTGSKVQVTLSNINVNPPPGGTGLASYAMIVADGESTNGGESNVFTTNGSAWQELAKIPNGTYYPNISGVGTSTVTETGTQSGSAGSFVFGSFNNPTQISFTMTGSGLQGVVVGVRYASISVVSNFNGARINPADQIIYSLKTVLGSTIVQGSTSGTATSGFAPASIPTIAASYPFVLYENMAAGSVDTLASYGISLTCINNSTTGSSTVLPKNYSANQYTISSLQYGDAVVCTYTNTPIPYPNITGSVYNDANHNGAKDSTEGSLGISGLHVALTSDASGTCSTTATQVVPVNATSGDYTIKSVPPAEYCLVLTDSKSTTGIAPYTPPGWIGTENDGGVIHVAVNGASAGVPEDFGFYHGSTLSGIVFDDDGSGGATANDGKQEGTEAPIAGAAISAEANGTILDTETSAASGAFTVWVPYSVTSNSAATVTLVPAVNAYVPTWGFAGNSGATVQAVTGGGYTLDWSPATGVADTGIEFGFVPQNTLTPPLSQTGQAGSAMFFAHRFTAGSVGSVTFASANSSSPSGLAFATALYQDLTCSGSINSSDPLITKPLSVLGGQTVCLIAKEVLPAGAQPGASDGLTISAVETYTSTESIPQDSVQVSDTATVIGSGAIDLTKTVADVTTGGAAATAVQAAPGDVLRYTVTATNTSDQPVTSVTINDATPPYTTFDSAACPAALPSGITSCTVATSPASGAAGSVEWNLGGDLPSGQQISVTYEVTIAH